MKNNPEENRSFDTLLLCENSPFAVKEAYKTLRTNIAFALPDKGAKVIAVTSANRMEGKTSTAINTALSFANVGKKVILLDCDMRIPTVATKLKLRARPGLSDYLIGDAELENCIRKYAGTTLQVIPAGSIPADPTGLLDSAAFRTLLSGLKSHFDYIVIDFPPVNTVIDAAILSKEVDGYLLVVRHNETEFKQVFEMKKALLLANAKIIGFAYNDAPIATKSKYYKYGFYTK